MTSSHLHYNLPLIRQLVVIHEEKDDIVDPCLNTETPKDALCLVGSKMNLTWKCKDQYDFTGKTNECLPPNNFLIIAAKEKFLRFKIKTNSSNIVFDDDPFVILPISSVGHPTSIVYDALSTERYLYWIDAHDQHNGRIKKASDDGTIPSKYLNLKHDSNCSQIFDLVIDEIGRQLIMMTTITGSKYGTIIVGDIGKAGKVTGMDIDMKNDRVVWTTIGEYGGTIHAQQINGIGTREQIIGHELILPRTLNIFNGTVYFANEATKTIDVVKSDMTSSHLHYNLPLIRQLVVIHEEKDNIVDPCLNAETPKDALCLVESKMNLTWKCKDQYDFTGKTNECLPPNNFLLIAAKEKFLRFKIKTNSSNIVFDDVSF
uniref:Vitellogenin receptor n=1 Tax=Panagrolaimus sp. JU765 TaxID=591449 RepID=A0AC34RGL0_9BILA